MKLTDEEIEKAAYLYAKPFDQDYKSYSQDDFEEGAKWARSKLNLISEPKSDPKEKELKWISVQDDLPDIYDPIDYLVYGTDGFSIASRSGLTSQRTHLPIWQDNSGVFLHSVTHWMPMPDKPLQL